MVPPGGLFDTNLMRTWHRLPARSGVAIAKGYITNVSHCPTQHRTDEMLKGHGLILFVPYMRRSLDTVVTNLLSALQKLYSIHRLHKKVSPYHLPSTSCQPWLCTSRAHEDASLCVSD